MCELWSVLAALPDFPCHRRGGSLASRANRRHACRSFRRRRGQQRLRALHGDLCAVPRVRARLSERCAVRAVDGGHPRHVGQSESHDSLVATPRLPRARPPSFAAGRLHLARNRSASPPGAKAAGLAGVGLAARCAARGNRRRGVAVHRLRDGCVATRHASQHRQGLDRRGCHVSSTGGRRRVLRSAAHPCRSHRRGQATGPSGDAVDAGRGADRRQFGGVRRGVEGLRSSARHP